VAKAGNRKKLGYALEDCDGDGLGECHGGS
jgi:hypothetical protein